MKILKSLKILNSKKKKKKKKRLFFRILHLNRLRLTWPPKLSTCRLANQRLAGLQLATLFARNSLFVRSQLTFCWLTTRKLLACKSRFDSRLANRWLAL